MLKVGIIGYGAIAKFVTQELPSINAQLALLIARPGRFDAARAALGADLKVVESLGDERPDVVVDCAGHSGLQQNGAEILRAGVPLITVSIGALADSALQDELTGAARAGRTKLRLSTGAIGSLDAIASARFGALETVTYIGRKPPRGWKGSRAEEVVNLDELSNHAVTHFTGSARDAAMLYPKNANVAAAVALAGLGFDETQVELIADPAVDANIHEICAIGDFGEMQFTIRAKTLPNNTRTSALAAMSVVKMLADESAFITF